VTGVLCEEVARKKIDVLSAGFAIKNLHPKEILHGNIRVPIQWAVGQVEGSDVGPEFRKQALRFGLIGVHIEMLDLLPDDPGRHRVDIESRDGAADSIGFDQGRAAPHEGVSDPSSRKVVPPEVDVRKGGVSEFR
jgi:hypothetical protein